MRSLNRGTFNLERSFQCAAGSSPVAHFSHKAGAPAAAAVIP
jgi:hypothetical protein